MGDVTESYDVTEDSHMAESHDTFKDPRVHFSMADYAIFILLIIVSMIIGLVVGFLGWKKSTTKDFLVGGRKMHPIPVAMSLTGGVISAISVIGNATEMYLHGTQLWVNILGCFWGTLVVIFFVLPTLYPLELVSMMQFMELRFNSVLMKKVTSIAQLFNISLYLGLCLYTPSLTLSSVTDLPTWASIVCLGLVCTIYVSIGGVKAVVYTDVVQTSIMFIGILAVIVIVCVDLGGLGAVFSIADEGGRLQFFNLDPSPFVRHTFWSVQVLGLNFVVSEIGISQPQFQRLNSVRTLKISQGLCVMFYVGLVVLWSLFYLTGLVAYAAYADCDPLASKRIEKADQIIPYLVADKLSQFPGMTGLFVAAVYGAVLSSVSSQCSAFAALLWEDFLCDWEWFKNNVHIEPTNVTRIISAFAGFTAIAVAFLVGGLGTLFQATYSITGAFVGPMDGLFVTAIGAPWVNEKGALIGFISALVLNVWLVTGQYNNKAGQVPPLPLSTRGCSPSVFNSSHVLLSSSFGNGSSWDELLLTTEIPNLSAATEEVKEQDYPAIYDISYCYFGTIGIVMVLLISSMVSFLTGPVEPDDVNPKYVHGPSLKAYKWLWRLFSQKKTLKIWKGEDVPPEAGPGFSNLSLELEPMTNPKKKKEIL